MTTQSTQSMINKAQTLLGENRLAEAREIYLDICAQDQSNGTAWMMLGNLSGALGDAAEAEYCCKKAIELNPMLANAHANLGNALMVQNKFEDAAVSFAEAARLQPDLAPAWFMLGRVQQKLSQWNASEIAFRKTIELKPDWLDARLQLGNVLQNIGRSQDAIQQYEIIIQKQVDHAEAHYRLGVSLASIGETENAEASCRKALELQPDHISALNSLSMILSSQGQSNEALECCERVLNLKPNDINAACIASHIYEVMGDAHKAYKYLKPHIEAKTQHLNLALAFASVSKELGLQEQAITIMEDLLKQAPGLTNTGRRNLYFTLGKLCDGIQQYDRAFEHYRKGNELRPTQFKADNQSAKINYCIQNLTANFFNKAPKSSNDSERPVFIVGMPRSGTSLVEQILASHPHVYGAGELADIGKLAHSLTTRLNVDKPYPVALDSVTKETLNHCASQYLKHLNEMDKNALRVVDKMPGNFYFLGLIELMFPNARVIHCIRDPLDNCLSCYFQDFFQHMDWCYDQKNLAIYYNGYAKLMKHWKQVLNIPIMDVSYEELVDNQESISRKLIKFCDLDWTDNCLQFHKTQRFVSTASYDQVRKPIYRKSVARWKNYEAHIEPLIKSFNNS